MPTLFRRLLDRPSKPSPTSKLRLESLEDRDVPATITVTSLNDTVALDGVVTLREAIQSINTATAVNADVVPVGAFGTNDTIVFQGVTGTITLGGTALPVTKSVTIAGPGASALTINAKGASQIFNATASNVSISGLTLTGGNSGGPGGAILSFGNLTISNSVITGNQAIAGGGLAALGGNLTITGSTFSSNTVTVYGGALYASGCGNVTISNSTFSGNTATNNGGALNASESGTVTISNSTFSGNTATNNGGGLFFSSDGTVSITGSTISGNVSKNGRAGGLAAYVLSASAFTIQNSTVSGNSSFGDAGGIWVYVDNGGTANILNSTIAFNQTLTGPNFTGKVGTGKGGGIAVGLNATGVVNIRNTILSNNQQSGPVPNDFFRATLAGVGTLNANFSLIGASPMAGDINGTNIGNLSGDPLLGPLANNGGPTLTHLPQAGSQAINKGDPTFAAPPTTDQRGQPRVFGGRIDIGAVEVQTALPSLVTVGPGPGSGSRVAVLNPDGTTKTSFDTFDTFTGGVRVANADVNNDGVADYIVGTGPGAVTSVRVYDGKTLAQIAQFQPFESSFTGGVYVASGHINSDGFADVVVTPDEGGGPVVAVYNGATLAAGQAVELVRYFGIQDPNFRGGARAAVGDVNGDGIPDVVVSAGFLGSPRIQIWSGVTIAAGDQPTTSLANFFAFEESLRNGVFVAVGDLNGDGFGDLIFGGGPGGSPRVRIADGLLVLSAGNFGSLDNQDFASLTVGNFVSGNEATRGGVRVSTADLDGDQFADMVTGGGDGQPASVIAYPGATILGTLTPPSLFETNVFDTNNGVFVG